MVILTVCIATVCTPKNVSVFRKPSSIYDVFTLLQGKLTVI